MMVRPRTSTDTIRKMGTSGDLSKRSQYDGNRSSHCIMADQLYLSYWLRNHTDQTMLRHYEKFLKLFPFSRLARQPSTFKVIAVDYTESPVLEIPFPPPVVLEDVL